jgi:hypothetical protein
LEFLRIKVRAARRSKAAQPPLAAILRHRLLGRAPVQADMAATMLAERPRTAIQEVTGIEQNGKMLRSLAACRLQASQTHAF